jgi:hypothetical protein
MGRRLAGLCLIGAAAAAGAEFLDGFFDRFPGFAGAFLNPAQQFILLAVNVSQIVIRQLGPLLFQLALGDVPVAFDFECVHIDSLCFFVSVRRQCDGEKLQLSGRTRLRQRRAVRWGFNGSAVSEAIKPQSQ